MYILHKKTACSLPAAFPAEACLSHQYITAAVRTLRFTDLPDVVVLPSKLHWAPESSWPSRLVTQLEEGQVPSSVQQPP